MTKLLLYKLFKKFIFTLKYKFIFQPKYKFGLISVYPLVFFTAYDESVWKLLHFLRRLPLYCLISPYWTLTAHDQRNIAKRLGQWSKDYPLHRIIHLVPTDDEANVLRELGLPFEICSHSAFIDENIFHIYLNELKQYRAIYDARLTFFKRHQLAALVDNLALITYECSANHDDVYNVNTFRMLLNAAWLNGPFSEHNSSFTPEQVALHLNQARVGLILSDLEGANYASIQYLLCGLPVVTTMNRGGRDAFFNPDYVIWSEDSPEAVNLSVQKLIDRNLDPHFIRERTLAIVNQHRHRFIVLITNIFAREIGPKFVVPSWDKFFCNKLLKYYSEPFVYFLVCRYSGLKLIRSLKFMLGL